MPAFNSRRAVKMANRRLPPSMAKPTAFESLGSGNVTVPNPESVDTSFRLAPLPMKIRALEIWMASKSPCSTRVPPSSGSSTPSTVLRLMLSVALANTTSAIARPTVPPICSVGLVGISVRPALLNVDWVQSNRLPSATEVRVRVNDRLVARILTASTPCSCALPSEACNPVYFRAVANGL